MLLKDKVCIVSGIGPGMGGDLALLIAKEGGHVVMAARTKASMEQFDQAIKDLDNDAKTLCVKTDITDATQCESLVAQTLEKFGRVNCLFNNAYHTGSWDRVESANFSEWRATFDVNLYGSLTMSQKVIPAMRDNGGGSIVMINTMATRKPMLTHGGYAASKAALASAATHLAQEVGKDGIRVNSVFMGWMWGPGVQIFCALKAQENGTTPEEERAKIAENIALGDIPEDGDCAKAAMMLASDYACSVTGASLDVNGGEYFAH
jgi:NAD(P)-dependent dehydrogenase (short-subunit alcohol dehydrogenase family)